jgi:hypothetical protein
MMSQQISQQSQSTDHEMSPRQSEQSASSIPPARERAEFLVDQFGMQLGKWANSLGDGLQRFWARTREEGEDIWAEAQDVRQRNQVGHGRTGQHQRPSPSHDESGKAWPPDDAAAQTAD